MTTQVLTKLNRCREWAVYYKSPVLSDVDTAIAKELAGTYGKCDLCGDQIDWATRQACPQSTLCSKCQLLVVSGKSPNR